MLRSDARLCGVDRDPAWVENASARIAARGLAERIDFKAASAESLPFPDDSFDLVTCQTLLIHVSDPAAVIAEMCRVARPGGLVLACEPNNVSRALLFDSMSAQDPVEAILALVRFQLLCERGKAALGEGDILSATSFESVQRRRTGRSQRLPQRQGEPARAALRHARAARHGGRAGRLQRSQFWIWSRENMRGYFRGGGVTMVRALWSEALRDGDEVPPIDRGADYSGREAAIGYIVAGRKPGRKSLFSERTVPGIQRPRRRPLGRCSASGSPFAWVRQELAPWEKD